MNRLKRYLYATTALIALSHGALADNVTVGGKTYTADPNGGLTSGASCPGTVANSFCIGGTGISYTSPGKLTLSGSGAGLTVPSGGFITTAGANFSSIAINSGNSISNNIAFYQANSFAVPTTVLGRYSGGTPALQLAVNEVLGWSSNGSADLTNYSPDTLMGRASAAVLHFGGLDAAASVAQGTGVQGVVTGTSNTPGALWTYTDSAGTGNQASGGYAWQTHPLGTSGTQQNPAVTEMTLSSAGVFGLVNLAGTGSRPVCVTSGGNLEAGSLTSGLVTCP